MSKFRNEIWVFNLLHPEMIEKLVQEGYSVRQLVKKTDIAVLLKSEISEKPLLIIFDIELFAGQCWSIVHEITTHQVLKHVPLIIHTALDVEQLQIRSLNYGADLFLSKSVSNEVFLAQVNSVIRRKKFKEDSSEDNFLAQLSKREIEILQFLAQGYTNKQIAEKTFITTLTVANHVKRIFKKINVTNRAQAALFAIRNELVNLML